jgi:hypothetical protein
LVPNATLSSGWAWAADESATVAMIGNAIRLIVERLTLLSVVMPAKAGIHVFFVEVAKDVDGRDEARP